MTVDRTAVFPIFGLGRSLLQWGTDERGGVRGARRATLWYGWLHVSCCLSASRRGV